MVACQGERCLAMVRDLTDQKRAEEEGERLQVQMAQTQKMEAIGRLAGGVAHDFNNMLCVIIGLSDLLLAQLDPVDRTYGPIREIFRAANRSAELTRQLLAFARRQVIQPVVLDLNELVEGMMSMLKRLIGEDIELTLAPGPGLWRVKMDPSQLDQILVNLCVNARDAIGGVGRITLETCNVTIAQAGEGTPAELVPGDWVRLTVADTGRGMDEEIRAKLFEPFFTTKEVGKGTGLGLAMVDGIVRQNPGAIQIRSGVGEGTVFMIFLPRALGPVAPRPDGGQGSAAPGHETILVVEDEPAILAMAGTLLRQQGYRVLSAAAPGEAVRLAENHPGPIGLLLTDVILPEMNGRDLADTLRAIRPGLRTLFMSGFDAGPTDGHGGARYLQKPFSMKALAESVREALDLG